MKRIAVFSEHQTEGVYWDNIQSEYANDVHIIRTNKPLTLELASELEQGTDAVITLPQIPTTREILSVLRDKGVKVLSMRSVGLDSVDLDAAKELGITVTNVPVYSPQAIAETAVYFALAGLRNLKQTVDSIMRGDFAHAKKIGRQIDEVTIGIIGFGHIGQMFCSLLAGFHPRVIAYVRNKDEIPEDTWGYVSYEEDMDKFLTHIDVLSIHTPLTPSTEHMLNAEFFAKMKKGSIVINTARGGLVDTAAMVDALTSGQVGFYGTDVYEFERPIFNKTFDSLDEIPDPLFQKLVKHPNVMLTPHTSYNTYTSVKNMVNIGFQHAIDALQ